MGKGVIARYEQFLLFPRCFQKASFPEASKGVIVWEWVKKAALSALERRSQEIHTLVQGPLSHDVDC